MNMPYAHCKGKSAHFSKVILKETRETLKNALSFPLSLSLLSVSSLFLSLSLSLALSPPGILYGTMTLELGGQITIACEKTGYSAQLEFKLKVRKPQPLPLFLKHKSSANMAASCHHQLHSCPKKIPHPSICQFIHPSIHLCTDPLCDSATGAENRGEK